MIGRRGSSYYRGPVSTHFDGRRFSKPDPFFFRARDRRRSLREPVADAPSVAGQSAH